MAKKLGNITMDLVANTTKFKRGLDEATRRTRSFTRNQKSLTNTIAKNWKLIGTAITALASSRVIYGFRRHAQGLDAIAKSARAAGVSFKTLSGIQFAASFDGINPEEITNAFARLNKVVGELKIGLNTTNFRIFERLNIDFAAFAALSVESQFKAIADALTQIESPAERTAIATALMGRSAANMIPFLVKGSQNMGVLENKARKLGISLSDDAVASVEAMDDEFTLVGERIEGIINVIITKMAPAIQQMTKDLNDWLDKAQGGKTLEEILHISPQAIESIQNVVNLLSLTGFFLVLRKLWVFLTQVGSLAQSVVATFLLLPEALARTSANVSNLLSLVPETMKSWISLLYSWFADLIGIINKADKTVRGWINSLSDASFFGKKIFEGVKLDAAPLLEDFENSLRKKSFEIEVRPLSDPFKNAISFLDDFTVAMDETATRLQYLSRLTGVNTSDPSSLVNFLNVKPMMEAIINFNEYVDSVKIKLQKPINIPVTTQDAGGAGTDDEKEVGNTYDSLINTNKLNVQLSRSRGLNKDVKKLLTEQIALIKQKISAEGLVGDELIREKINIQELTNAIRDMEPELSKLQNVVVGFGDALEDAFVNAAAQGKFAFEDLANFVVAQIVRMLAQAAIIQPLFGTTGIVTNFFGGFFADGGRPPTGKVSMVGEEGPELFVPDTAGKIIPNDELYGRSSGNTFYVDNRGASVEAVARLESLVGFLNGSIEQRAMNAVEYGIKRDPNFLRR